MRPSIHRLPYALALALLGACVSLPPYGADTSVVVPAGGKAVARLDLAHVAPLEIDLDVEGNGDIKVAIETARGGKTSSIETESSLPPHHYHQRFDRKDGVLTITVESTQPATIHYRIESYSGVDLKWSITHPDDVR